jgi:hypothetical protein
VGRDPRAAPARQPSTLLPEIRVSCPRLDIIESLLVWTGLSGGEGGLRIQGFVIRHLSKYGYLIDRGSMGGRIRSRSRSGVKPQRKVALRLPRWSSYRELTSSG